ncbi:uncharacterized protein BXZ73DRAFT_73683 [Epithele typhae]|uniref:uncharacterized protein n=1 Tax=Epithele typhae TaxID=378194 RepID=UPI00200846A7|nr:uncharacterized protein BXZ73DRAFT_73683 [Epithele typhae]KAH9944059.1 hypothetical protein BXZ73DRAFT_73683 [Epithele typhae]
MPILRRPPPAQTYNPVSNLPLALARMTALRRLRVFSPARASPSTSRTRFHRGASLPSPSALPPARITVLIRAPDVDTGLLRISSARCSPADGVPLAYYELFLGPDTRVQLLKSVRAEDTVALRLSGDLAAPPPKVRKPLERKGQQEDTASTVTGLVAPMPALRGLTIHGVTGTLLERRTIEELFPEANLEAFTWAKLCFELRVLVRVLHLRSLAAAHGTTMRTLILPGCLRLSSEVVMLALEQLQVPETFTLHPVTVNGLRNNFVLALPLTLQVFRLQVINAPYTDPLKDQERMLCRSIEDTILLRDKPLDEVSSSTSTAV